MAEVFRICGLAAMAAVMALLLKRTIPEAAAGISVSAGIIILLIAFSHAAEIFGDLRAFAEKFGDLSAVFTLMLKLTGIACLVEFAAASAADFGESALGEKLRFAGKIIMLSLVMPVVLRYIENILSLLP